MNWIFNAVIEELWQPFLRCSSISGKIKQLFNSYSVLHCTGYLLHKLSSFPLKEICVQPVFYR